MSWLLLLPIVLLSVSNVFMTFAWYGQLKFPATPLWLLVLAGWGIAFFEYCFAVPANHYGHQVYSAAQLKTMQEVIIQMEFALFSVTYLGEAIKRKHEGAYGIVFVAAFFDVIKWSYAASIHMAGVQSI